MNNSNENLFVMIIKIVVPILAILLGVYVLVYLFVNVLFLS